MQSSSPTFTRGKPSIMARTEPSSISIIPFLKENEREENTSTLRDQRSDYLPLPSSFSPRKIRPHNPPPGSPEQPTSSVSSTPESHGAPPIHLAGTAAEAPPSVNQPGATGDEEAASVPRRHESHLFSSLVRSISSSILASL